MKPWEVWTCQRAENLIKKKSSKIPKNNYAATMVSAARPQIIGGGGGAPINKSRRRWRPQIVGGGAAGARLYFGFIHCRHLYSASSSGTTQKRSQPQLSHENQSHNSLWKYQNSRGQIPEFTGEIIRKHSLSALTQ